MLAVDLDLQMAEAFAEGKKQDQAALADFQQNPKCSACGSSRLSANHRKRKKWSKELTEEDITVYSFRCMNCNKRTTLKSRRFIRTRKGPAVLYAVAQMAATSATNVKEWVKKSPA